LLNHRLPFSKSGLPGESLVPETSDYAALRRDCRIDARISEHIARKGTRPRQPADQRYGNAHLFGVICPAKEKGAAIAMPNADTEAMQEHIGERIADLPVTVAHIRTRRACARRHPRGARHRHSGQPGPRRRRHRRLRIEARRTGDCRLRPRSGLPGQVKAVVFTLLFSGIGSAILYKVVDLIIGLRVAPDQEREGLDVSEHGERAYNN
jgi:hypothetical protein